ncbi:hypothetical protein EK21DRAFT_111393 [Setomelanomma holmii]|uniref:Uncharacterized protein n=1 Tax=Setomelanomma holmii TaxID=210430 RepID=A0A9P4HAK0_9PLEO|nr:hypothetical protein EK21DRAFT_111393 [Setomelanomma holmii]
MKIAIVSARYMEQNAIEAFFGQIFGFGQARVMWTRGKFQCMLPRALTPTEMDSMRASVEFTHYNES